MHSLKTYVIVDARLFGGETFREGAVSDFGDSLLFTLVALFLALFVAVVVDTTVADVRLILLVLLLFLLFTGGGYSCMENNQNQIQIPKISKYTYKENIAKTI